MAEWDGIDVANGDASHDAASNSGTDSDSEDEIHDPVDSLLTSLGPRLDARSKGQLSKRAALFFDRPDFEGIDTEEMEDHLHVSGNSLDTEVHADQAGDDDKEDSPSDDDFEEVPAQTAEPVAWDDDDSDDGEPPPKPGMSIESSPDMKTLKLSLQKP